MLFTSFSLSFPQPTYLFCQKQGQEIAQNLWAIFQNIVFMKNFYFLVNASDHVVAEY